MAVRAAFKQLWEHRPMDSDKHFEPWVFVSKG